MPHLLLECSDNISQKFIPREVLLKLHNCLVETGEFQLSAIKSRYVSYTHFAVGDGEIGKGFINLEVSILDGRSPLFCKELSGRLLNLMKDIFSSSMQIAGCSMSVEIREIDRGTYSKETVGTV